MTPLHTKKNFVVSTNENVHVHEPMTFRMLNCAIENVNKQTLRIFVYASVYSQLET